MLKRTVVLIVFCLALPALSVAGEAKKRPAKHLPKKYTTAGFPEARFTCRVPARWKKIRSGELDSQERVRGIVLMGPQERSGFAPTISVYYYEPGNPEFEDIEEYVDTHYNPAIRAIMGQDVEKPKALELAGLPARSFHRTSYERVPQHSMDTRNLKKRETHIVLKYDKGFFALTYSAPPGGYDKWLPVFERVVETFKPTPDIEE